MYSRKINSFQYKKGFVVDDGFGDVCSFYASIKIS